MHLHHNSNVFTVNFGSCLTLKEKHRVICVDGGTLNPLSSGSAFPEHRAAARAARVSGSVRGPLPGQPSARYSLAPGPDGSPALLHRVSLVCV